MTSEEALQIALRRTGVGYPRGVLGTEAAVLADAISSEDPSADIAALVDAVAAAHWPELQASMRAGLERGKSLAGDEDAEAFDIVLPMAERRDADHPLARALAVDAGLLLSRARSRAREMLLTAEPATAEGGPPAAVAASQAAGAAAVALLDLDPEDFEPEIVAYVARDEGDPESLAELARATGDPEVRSWARAALRDIEHDDAPAATDALAHLVAGPPPEDPAEDLVWVPAILELVQQGVERAMAADAAAELDEPPG